MALPVLRALRSGLDGRRITLVGPWAPLLIGQGVAEGCVGYPPGGPKRRGGPPRGRPPAGAGVNPRPRTGIHLGAAFGPSKLWPAELIAGLCRELRQRRLVPVLLGTPSEEGIANGIVAATGGEVVSLVGRGPPP